MGVCDTSDYRVPGKVEGAIYGASCCNVVALIFFICVIFSPFTVWSVNSAANNRFGTGPFVPSASRYDFLCAAGEAYVWCIGTFVPQQWNSWKDIESSQRACSNDTNIYTRWSGPYGFCDKIDGEFKVIPEILAIQSFNILAFIFLFFATCAGCTVVATKKTGVIVSSVLTFLAMISCLISFSLMTTTQWYKDLRSSQGSYLPIFTGGKLVAMPAANWGYGPAFGLIIVVWIWTLFAFLYYVYLSRWINEELEAAFDKERHDEEAETGAPKTGEAGDVVQS